MFIMRTITVRGTGKVSMKPDLTVVSVTLKSLDKNYEKSMQEASGQIESIRTALCGLGFGKDELKTLSFNVNAEYEGIRDENGNYKNVFSGYSVMHRLKVEFSFDSKRLSDVLYTVSGCTAEPEMNIHFTVKDKDAVKKTILENAAKDARERAEILASASGVKLGELVSVTYGEADINVYSRTEYAVEKRCMAMNGASDMCFTPDDIETSDDATFVWEIV